MSGSSPERVRTGKTASSIIALSLLGIWFAVVIFTVTRHELWRDEVRAFSLARAAHSPIDVFLIRNEGHPVLWYLLLYIGKSIVDTPLVLPTISVAIAFAGVSVFMFRSPFPLWIKGLFIFNVFPLYEYSVMARNYGISMLLFFVAAALYRKRDQHSLLLAFVLGLLANTNLHSALLVCLITAKWIWDTLAKGKKKAVQVPASSFYFGLAIIVTSLGLCAATTVPDKDSFVSSFLMQRYLAQGEGLLKLAAVVTSHPEKFFWGIVPPWLPPFIDRLLLYLVVLGLLCCFNSFLVALASLISLGVFFQAIYFGFLRHQGLFLILLLFLYWTAIESSDGTRQSKTHFQRFKDLGFNIGLYGVLPILLLGGICRDDIVYRDLKSEMSSSKAFGAFLNQSEAYRNAIVVGEPAFLLESLPYYAGNAIYFPREHRFGTVSLKNKPDQDLSLGQLLSIARDLKAQYRRPVLIVLKSWPLAEQTKGSRSRIFGIWKFTWTSEELDDADQTLQLVGSFQTALGDENYAVLALR